MENALNRLNFDTVLKLDTAIDQYDFSVYAQQHRHPLKGFCTLCEESGVHQCPSDSSFRLNHMSHGASTKDVLMATGQTARDFSDWHEEGVVFLMEGPSVDWGFYEEVEYNGYKKKPTREWYWIHAIKDTYQFPQEFRGGRYGSLFNSIIFTFKLKNAYQTNLVKCGLNNHLNMYKGIEHYNWKCLETCVEHILLRELELMQPKVVFCFGSKVINALWDLYPEDYPFLVVGLPHPAGQRRGFKDEFYRHLYFTRILEGLYQAGIVSLDQATAHFHDFLAASAPKTD